MLKKLYLEENTVEAAKKRTIEIFKNNPRIVMYFSGGKDSIVLASIVYNLCVSGKVDKKKLIVQFIDEEAMFDEVIDITKLWRNKFMDIDVPFEWYCIPVKHYNCLNSLSEDETFVCWDPTKQDVWVREMPKFAIKDHHLLIPIQDNYQAFTERHRRAYDYVGLVGVRTSESVQRLKCIAKINYDNKQYMQYPIYDMNNQDVWLYILRNDLELPAVYENMYRVGVAINKLRISQFFSIDTARILVILGEMYPDLMTRVTRREPNAYLCMMYWDTEMFGKNTRKRKQIESDEPEKDYKALVIDLIRNPSKLENKSQIDACKTIKNIYIKTGEDIDQKIAKMMYEAIVVGDPKNRKIRAIFVQIGKVRKNT